MRVRRAEPNGAGGRGPNPGKGWSGGWFGEGWAGRYRIRLGAAVPAVAASEDLAGVPQVAPVEIGPERVEKHKFGVGGLPEQEVRKALLAGGPDEKVHFGNRRLVKIASEHLFV